MYDITEAGIDADLPEDEHAEPVGLQQTKRSIDMEVAVITGLPMKEVNTVTAVFLDLAMTAIARQGKLYLHQFGTFTVKKYKGKALAQNQLGKKVPRSRRQVREGITKNEIRFAKSRGFRRRFRDLGWWPSMPEEHDR
jgi:nucleoid DNA-binding protein